MLTNAISLKKKIDMNFLSYKVVWYIGSSIFLIMHVAIFAKDQFDLKFFFLQNMRSQLLYIFLGLSLNSSFVELQVYTYLKWMFKKKSDDF